MHIKINISPRTIKRRLKKMSEIFKVEGQLQTWNIEGSSDDSPPFGFSWISWAEHATGKKRGRCSYTGCDASATCGGHVWIKHLGCFIAPICSGCNYNGNSKRWQGSGSTLRDGIVVIKREMTVGMLNTDRKKIRQNNKCINCKKTFTPKNPNHKKCDKCANEYFHHAATIGPWWKIA